METSGGAGADSFGLGTWLENGNFANITDYTPGEDRIFVLFDETDTAPAVTISDNGADALVFADGIQVARVTGLAGQLTAAAIIIQGQPFGPTVL